MCLNGKHIRASQANCRQVWNMRNNVYIVSLPPAGGAQGTERSLTLQFSGTCIAEISLAGLRWTVPVERRRLGAIRARLRVRPPHRTATAKRTSARREKKGVSPPSSSPCLKQGTRPHYSHATLLLMLLDAGSKASNWSPSSPPSPEEKITHLSVLPIACPTAHKYLMHVWHPLPCTSPRQTLIPQQGLP